MKTPRIDISSTAFLAVGMGVEAARISGYRHGFEMLNSRSINCMTQGSPEWSAWERGYQDGKTDAAHDEHTFRCDECRHSFTVFCTEEDAANIRRHQICPACVEEAEDHRYTGRMPLWAHPLSEIPAISDAAW